MELLLRLISPLVTPQEVIERVRDLPEEIVFVQGRACAKIAFRNKGMSMQDLLDALLQIVLLFRESMFEGGNHLSSVSTSNGIRRTTRPEIGDTSYDDL